MLNQVILDAGRLLRQAGDMHLHLATAYPPDMQGVGKTTTLEARELLIPQLADELKVKLVVLDTVARSGLKSFLLGNASEQSLAG